MKIFVTGASGFIGFHLSRKLINMGWIVYGIDNMNHTMKGNIGIFFSNVKDSYIQNVCIKEMVNMSKKNVINQTTFFNHINVKIYQLTRMSLLMQPPLSLSIQLLSSSFYTHINQQTNPMLKRLRHDIFKLIEIQFTI